MSGRLFDTSVLLDIRTADTTWLRWSEEQVRAAVGPVLINPIIYAEVSARFERIEELDDALPVNYYRRVPLPFEAAFLAGQCFMKYKRRGGNRRSPMPDFYIGAHAALSGLTLLTRDARRYRDYFPTVRIIAP